MMQCFEEFKKIDFVITNFKLFIDGTKFMNEFHPGWQ